MTPHWRHLVKLIKFPRGQGVATSVRTSIHAHPLWLHFHICKINYLVDDRFSYTAKSSSCCIFMPDENSIETLQTTENAIATRLISVLLRILVLEEVPTQMPMPKTCIKVDRSKKFMKYPPRGWLSTIPFSTIPIWLYTNRRIFTLFELAATPGFPFIYPSSRWSWPWPLEAHFLRHFHSDFWPSALGIPLLLLFLCCFHCFCWFDKLSGNYKWTQGPIAFRQSSPRCSCFGFVFGQGHLW